MKELCHSELKDSLENENITIYEGKDFKENKSTGREFDVHERHKGDELVHVNESPEILNTRLAKH